MTLTIKRARDLTRGDVLALPMNKTVTILTTRPGTRYMNVQFVRDDDESVGKTRYELDYEVALIAPHAAEAIQAEVDEAIDHGRREWAASLPAHALAERLRMMASPRCQFGDEARVAFLEEAASRLEAS
jgi:hypothetical protein